MTEEFDFAGAAGSRLAGRLERPSGIAIGWAILAHCFTCGKDSLASVHVSRALAARGIGVLRFDFAGIGASEGDLAHSTFGGDVDDLVAAAGAMADEGMTPALLVGHSLGGAVILIAAARLPGVRAVATIAAPAAVAHVLDHLTSEELASIERDGEGPIRLGGRSFAVRQSFVDALRTQDLVGCVESLGKPLLLLHSPLDEAVGIENATELFHAAKHPKSFVSLDSADHLLTSDADGAFAADLIAAWARRYI